MTPQPLVLSTRDGPTATLALNRPDKRNAMSDEMLEAFNVELARAIDDDDVRSIVVTGSGECFTAGRDRKDVGSAGSAPGDAGRVVELQAVGADGRVGWTGRYAGTAAALLGQAAGMAGDLAHASGWRPPPAGRARSAEALRHYLEGVSLLEGWDVPRSDDRAG